MPKLYTPRPDDTCCCQFCGFYYPTVHELVKHVRDTHVKGKYWCTKCGNHKSIEHKSDYFDDKRHHQCWDDGSYFEVRINTHKIKTVVELMKKQKDPHIPQIDIIDLLCPNGDLANYTTLDETYVPRNKVAIMRERERTNGGEAHKPRDQGSDYAHPSPRGQRRKHNPSPTGSPEGTYKKSRETPKPRRSNRSMSKNNTPSATPKNKSKNADSSPDFSKNSDVRLEAGESEQELQTKGGKGDSSDTESEESPTYLSHKRKKRRTPAGQTKSVRLSNLKGRSPQNPNNSSDDEGHRASRRGGRVVQATITIPWGEGDLPFLQQVPSCRRSLRVHMPVRAPHYSMVTDKDGKEWMRVLATQKSSGAIIILEAPSWVGSPAVIFRDAAPEFIPYTASLDHIEWVDVYRAGRQVNLQTVVGYNSRQQMKMSSPPPSVGKK